MDEAVKGDDVRTKTEPGRYADGGGLFLEIKRSKAGTLSRYWIFRFQLNDKRRDMGLGSFPAITLTEARRKANEARVCIARGTDPLDARAAARDALRAAKRIPTFGAISPSSSSRTRRASPSMRRCGISGSATSAPHIPARCSIVR
jgi:hypothetical protein